eukprot:SAG22_NODE_440_length_10484_cov_19.751661_8_plen_101_part_00
MSRLGVLGNAGYRGYPELAYSGALSAQQLDSLYKCMASDGGDGGGGSGGGGRAAANRSLMLGLPGTGNTIALRAPFGLAHGLLQHDWVERVRQRSSLLRQ